MVATSSSVKLSALKIGEPSVKLLSQFLINILLWRNAICVFYITLNHANQDAVVLDGFVTNRF
jgi:hypothetical protein